MGGIIRCNGLQGAGNGRHQGVRRARLGGAQPFFDFTPHLFNGIEIGGIRRPPTDRGPQRGDQGLDRRPFVRGQIVHDHAVTGPQGGHQHLADIGQKNVVVRRALDDHARRGSSAPDGGNHGRAAPMTMRGLVVDPLAARRPAPQTRHVGLGARFIQEYQPIHVPVGTLRRPRRAGRRNVGAVLFAGAECLFLYVSPKSAKA